ncbi:APC family permease [Actinoplanes friuliensis]|uniref:Amino acid permease-associated protein n=1 Tax=Actinoplanes friuliensis DSM 7358 TaxID=1246995 RepID=U5VT81_9ACTN|nr:APC family permease [Actinoplanes friuliensis]AGZ38866.1 amino acid permease-associated protein [Actinoplanes friuliensis DSM 7358]
MPPPRTPAAGRLGGMSIVFLALAAVTPLTVVATIVPDAYAVGELLGLPLLFAGAGLLLLIFVAGHAAMSRRLPHAGPLYSIVTRGLGRPLGIGAAWLAVLSYGALQLGLLTAASRYLPGVPWWAVVLGGWAVVAVCGVLRLAVSAWLLVVLVLAETVVIVGYSAADVVQPAGGQISWAALAPAQLSEVPRPALGLLLVVVALTFIGFETAAAYAEEARTPRRTITRATYLSVLLLAILFVTASWAMTVATGPDRIAAEAGARGPDLVFDLAAARLAPWAVTLGRVLVVTGLLAAAIALHQTISRYLFALGRERVLPHRPTSTPARASLVQTVLVGLMIGGGALIKVDPALLSLAGGLGILVLLLGVSLAALLFLNRQPAGEGAWNRLAPGLSTITLGALVYLAIDEHRTLGIVAAAVLALGVVHGLVLRAATPVTYAGLGLGGTPVVVTPSKPPVRAVPRQREPGAHRPERVNREELTG